MTNKEFLIKDNSALAAVITQWNERYEGWMGIYSNDNVVICPTKEEAIAVTEDWLNQERV